MTYEVSFTERKSAYGRLQEGMEMAYNLGRNMAWIIKALTGAVPPIDDK